MKTACDIFILKYLGKGKFVSCEGNKPMSVVWKMEKAMPVWVVSESSAIPSQTEESDNRSFRG